MKQFMAYFDRAASFLGNLTIFSSILIATLYFVLPDLRRWVELNLTNRYAWYMVGVIKPAEQRWALYPENGEPFQNYYHVDWQKWRDGKRNPIVPATINRALGSVLIHEATHNVLGRSQETIEEADGRKSNNKVIAISTSNDCLVPSQFLFVDATGKDVSENNAIQTAYVWMWAAKVTCN